jgi:molecular chaperone Hsp33
MATELLRFLFEGLPVRGSLVRLDDSWRELLRRRDASGAYAPEVVALLGEMTAAGVLMHSSLKFDGALVLQISGDGPVKLAVAEVQSGPSFRCTATVTAEVPAGAQLEALVNVNAKGRCAITLDPRERRPGQVPYQGVVPLHGDQREPLQQVQQVLEHYMLQSEQLDTRLLLAANAEVAAGLLIQRMPVEGAGNLEGARNEDQIGLNEDFQRIALLAQTLTRDELLSLPPQQVLRRLFWQETVRLFTPEVPRFACRCSRERVRGMLTGLGREECEDILRERGGRIEVACEFCGLEYHFDAVDVAQLALSAHAQAPSSGTVQ